MALEDGVYVISAGGELANARELIGGDHYVVFLGNPRNVHAQADWILRVYKEGDQFLIELVTQPIQEIPKEPLYIAYDKDDTLVVLKAGSISPIYWKIVPINAGDDTYAIYYEKDGKRRFWEAPKQIGESGEPITIGDNDATPWKFKRVLLGGSE